MNMSTASLHSSIIDLLISYAEWFFPEQAEPINKKDPDQHFNLNESKKYETASEESCENTSEVNGNNLAVSNSIPSDCPSPSCSPRSPHKGLKKLAAPPPPAQRPLDKYLHEKVSLVETAGGLPHATMGSESDKLIDLSCEEQTVKMLNPNDVPLLNKRQHEASSTKSEKPVIPDKPGYNSLSLDRRSHRHSASFKDSRGAQRTSEIISRPSVPPPERPVKPPKFSSSTENIFVSEEQSKVPKDSENVPLVSNTCQKSPDMISFDEQSEDTLSSSNVVKTSPNTLHHSQSFSKGHRFDFLVNQKEEKPPERPPRSVGVTDGNTKPEALNLSSVPFDSNSPPPVAPRTTEVEKVKPARPQPPLLPAKPKLLSQSENTNL